MRVKISKRYSCYSYDSFSTKLFEMFLVTVLTKLLKEFGNFKFNLKRRLQFNTVANGKMKNYLGNGQP